MRLSALKFRKLSAMVPAGMTSVPTPPSLVQESLLEPCWSHFIYLPCFLPHISQLWWPLSHTSAAFQVSFSMLFSHSLISWSSMSNCYSWSYSLWFLFQWFYFPSAPGLPISYFYIHLFLFHWFCFTVSCPCFYGCYSFIYLFGDLKT